MDIELIKKRFNEELWPLNPNGNFSSSFAFVRSAIAQNITVQDKVVDFDFILQKYKDHLLKYQYEHGWKAKDQLRYIKTEDKIKTIEDFIRDQGYKMSYEIQRPPRDKYLFHTLSVQDLNKALVKWKESINERKKKI